MAAPPRREAAVGRALEWLKRNQRRDGSWSLTGPFTGGGLNDSQGRRHRHGADCLPGRRETRLKTGKYQEQVRNGWRALLKEQDQDGNFYHGGQDEERPYSQGLAMIAICEIYGMTKSSMFRGPAQKAVDYAVKIQAPEGGWRYQPGVDTDTSVTGWYVMGLQSALMAGLEVPSPTLQRVSEYLDTVALDGGSLYRYQPVRQGYSLAMTAEGLLCRQYLGWKQNDPRLLRGAKVMLENGIDWEDRDVYYWYYATQVLHHLEGDLLGPVEQRDARSAPQAPGAIRQGRRQLGSRRRSLGLPTAVGSTRRASPHTCSKSTTGTCRSTRIAWTN